MGDQFAAVVEFNQFEYALQPVLLHSGKTVQALRQTKLKSSMQILDWTSLSVDMNMGEGADSFSVELNNDDGKYTDVFVPFQEIVIYVGFPVVPGRIVKEELTPLLYGLIDSSEPMFDESNGHRIVVDGRNYAAVLLDNKLTENYDKMTSTNIVKDIIAKYGLGLEAQIAVTSKKYGKTINTSNSAAAKMKNKLSANVQITEQSQSVIDKFKGVANTSGGADNWLFKGKTAWEAIEYLAFLENDNDSDNNREIVTYFDGKTFYFGPRRNVEDDPKQLIQLNVGENVKKYRFKQSTEFLKTRVILRSMKQKNGVTTKEAVTVTIPDDLRVGTDISAEEMQGFQALQKLYGVREIIIQDRDKAWGGSLDKLKKVGIAKLKQFTRLAYSGNVDFVFLSDLDNTKINLLRKDMAVAISGIPAQTGTQVPPFTKPQSKLLNAIFYIERAHHTIDDGGWQVGLEVSSRKPQRQKQLSNLTRNTNDGLAKRINTGVSEREVDLETEIVD